jgi:lysophospholipase L1-like esterase
VLASFAFSLVLCETVLRFSAFAFHLYPKTIEFGSPSPQAMASDYEPDEDLLWVTKGYHEKVESAQADHPTIVFMGDSCSQFGRYDQFLSRLIMRRKRLDRISYVNLGVGGWSSYQGLQQLKRDIIKMRPKLITIYYGWNDHWNGFGIEDKDVARVSSSFWFRLQDVRLVQLVTKAYVALSRQRRDKLPKRVSAEDFRQNLGEMVRLARRHDIIPVLLTAPTTHSRGREPAYLKGRFLENLDELVPLHQRYVSIVREVARDEGAILCDLAAKFDALPRQEVAADYFSTDGIHLKRKGNKRIAEFLFECFEANGLFRKIM